MIKDKIIKGLVVKYDYPPEPPLGVNLSAKYKIVEKEGKCVLTLGNQEIELTEDEIRTYFTEVDKEEVKTKPIVKESK